MSSKVARVFPAICNGPERRKAAGFQRLPPVFPIGWGARRSEPSSVLSVRPAIGAAIAVVAVAVIAAVPAAIVAVPIETLHPALPPLVAAAEPAVHAGQHGKAALLAVIQRLVERVG